MSTLTLSLVIKAYDRASAGLRRVSNNLKTMRKRITSLSKRSRKLGSETSLIASSVGMAYGKMKAALDAPTESFESFDAAIERAGAVAGATGAEFKIMRDEAMRLGASIGEFSALDAAKGMIFFGQAGYNAAQVLKTVPTAMNLATAADVDMATSVDYLTGVLGAFSLKADQANRVGNVMAATFMSSKTTAGDIAEAWSYAGSVMAGFGVSVEKAAVMTGILGNSMIIGSRAGTAMRAIMLRLAAPRTDKAKGLIQKYIGKFNSKDLQDPMKLLERMKKRFDKLGLSAKKQGAVLNKVFGQIALPGVQALLASFGTGKYAQLTRFIPGAQARGDLDTFVARIRSTSLNTRKEMESIYDTLKINLGAALGPSVKALNETIRDGLLVLNKWAMAHPKAAALAMKLFGAVTMLTGALFVLLIPVSVSAGAFGVLAAAFGSTLTGSALLGLGLKKVVFGLRAAALASLKFAGALLTNPIFLAVAAIAALIAAAWLLYKNWDRVHAYLGTLWERFTGMSLAAKYVITGIMGPLALVYAPVIAAVYSLAGAAKFLERNWLGIKASLLTFWDDVKSTWKDAVAWISGLFDQLAEKLKIFENPYIQAAFGAVHSAGSSVAGYVGGAAGDVAGFAKGLAGDALNAFGPEKKIAQQHDAMDEARAGVEVRILSDRPATIQRTWKRGAVDIDAAIEHVAAGGLVGASG